MGSWLFQTTFEIQDNLDSHRETWPSSRSSVFVCVRASCSQWGKFCWLTACSCLPKFSLHVVVVPKSFASARGRDIDHPKPENPLRGCAGHRAVSFDAVDCRADLVFRLFAAVHAHTPSARKTVSWHHRNLALAAWAQLVHWDTFGHPL